MPAKLDPQISSGNKYYKLLNDEGIDPSIRQGILDKADALSDEPDGTVTIPELEYYFSHGTLDEVVHEKPITIDLQLSYTAESLAFNFNPPLKVYLKKHGITAAETTLDVPAEYRRYYEEAQAKLQSARNPVERNMAISAAYAEIYLKHPELKFMGMAAHGSNLAGISIRVIEHFLHGYPLLPSDQIHPIYLSISAAYEAAAEGVIDKAELDKLNTEMQTALIAGNNAIFEDFYSNILIYDHEGLPGLTKFKDHMPSHVYIGLSLSFQGQILSDIPGADMHAQGIRLFKEASRTFIYFEQSSTAEDIIYKHYGPLFTMLSPMMRASYNFKNPYDPLLSSSLYMTVGPRADMSAFEDRYAWLGEDMVDRWLALENATPPAKVKMRQDLYAIIAQYKTTIKSSIPETYTSRSN